MATDNIPDLIPDAFGSLDLRPPVQFLRVQRDLLPKKTNGLVEATVASGTNKGSTFSYGFFLTVPTLENYSYHVLTVTHDVQFYPATVATPLLNRTYQCNDEGEYINALAEVFGSSEFKRVVKALMAQAIENKE